MVSICKTIKVMGLPNREVGPNTRNFYKKKNQYFQEEKKRFEEYLLAYSAIFDPLLEQISLDIHFFPGDKRHRDVDNLIACCKPWIDAMQGNVIPKDDGRYLKSIRGEYESPVDEAYTLINIIYEVDDGKKKETNEILFNESTKILYSI